MHILIGLILLGAVYLIIRICILFSSDIDDNWQWFLSMILGILEFVAGGTCLIGGICDNNPVLYIGFLLLAIAATAFYGIFDGEGLGWKLLVKIKPRYEDKHKGGYSRW